jgi:hypothetical protein
LCFFSFKDVPWTTRFCPADSEFTFRAFFLHILPFKVGLCKSLTVLPTGTKWPKCACGDLFHILLLFLPYFTYI